MSIGIRSVVHLIGYIFMMHMDSFNLRFWSDSRAHSRIESFQRFIYFSGMIQYGNELQNPNQNPKLMESICIIMICPIK